MHFVTFFIRNLDFGALIKNLQQQIRSYFKNLDNKLSNGTKYVVVNGQKVPKKLIFVQKKVTAYNFCNF